MSKDAKTTKKEEVIVLDGDFNHRFERMLHESRKKKAIEERKKKQK